MPITVSCPHCTATLKAPDHRAGRRAKCKVCGQKLTVPFQFTQSESEPDAAPASGMYRPTRPGNGGMRLAIGAVVAGLCVVLAVGGYVVWVRFGPKSVPPKTIPTQHPDPIPPDPPKKTDSPAFDKKDDKKPRSKSSGPTLPPAPAGEKLVAKADVSIPLPGPAEKVHTVLVGSAGSMGVVLHRTFDGFNGRGAIDTCERFAIPSGVPAGKMEIPADGVPRGRLAALAPDGSKLAVEGPPGTLAVWHLDKETETKPESEVVPFPPAAGKPVPLAACYYLKDDRVLCVGPRGQVTVYDAGKKEKVVDAGSVTEKPFSEPLVHGKSIAITSDGRSLVLVAGGRVYEVSTGMGKATSSPIALPNGSTVRAVAVDPAGARILLAYATDSGSHVALYPLGAEKPKVVHPFPNALGEPSSADWLGNDCVLVGGTKPDGFVVFDAEVGKWVAYVRTPTTPLPKVRGTDRAYHLVPAEGGKVKLVGVEWPFDDFFTERDFAVNTKSIASFVLTMDGMRK